MVFAEAESSGSGVAMFTVFAARCSGALSKVILRDPCDLAIQVDGVHHVFEIKAKALRLALEIGQFFGEIGVRM